jgi:mRNA interferase MazF
MDRDPQAPLGPFPDTFKQGDIFWIEPDSSRGSIPGSPHPHVVVQDDPLTLAARRKLFAAH